MPFHVLIEKLMSKPKDNAKEKMISGCQVFFPDTVFYVNGAPKLYVQMDRDFCLSEEKKTQLIQSQELFPTLHKRILSRKQNTKTHWL